MPELNRSNLEKILDVEVVEVQKEMDSAPTQEEPEQILRKNIIRANNILDSVETELKNGNFSARLVEVASLIINSVTQASTQIMINKSNLNSLQIKRDVLKLKEKELEIKSRLLAGQQPVGRDRLVITDRETILKYLKDGQDVKQLETNKQMEANNDE
ncbi:MAG TPA: hypothetical protein P5293_08965 [Bacteroidales bacterium]|nr:hypothetical protein [Bacteroidales bacterium]